MVKFLIFSAAVILLALVVGILVTTGHVKSIDLKFVKVEFDGKPMERLCLPMWKVEESRTESIVVNKSTTNVGAALGNWHIEGGDGHGGTLLSYLFQIDGAISISNVELQSCSGCGGHFWLCPDPRCNGRPRIAHDPSGGPWIAYAATDGDPATTTTYRVTYMRSRPRCLW